MAPISSLRDRAPAWLPARSRASEISVILMTLWVVRKGTSAGQIFHLKERSPVNPSSISERAAKRAHNFNAGPGALPLPVLERMKEELLDWRGSGMSVMEMSHRSPEF